MTQNQINSSLELLAPSLDLEWISTPTHGRCNVIGFNTMSQAKDFISEHGGYIAEFKKRDGDSWKLHGRDFEPYTSSFYCEKKGDNYSIKTLEECYTYFQEELSEYMNSSASDIDKIDNAYEAMRAFMVFKEEFEKCDSENDVIIEMQKHKASGMFIPWVIEEVSKEFMGFHEDVTQYAIGVCLADVYDNNGELIESEDEQ